MASRKTYNCFVCQKSGYDVQVFLDGKTEDGKTVYKNPDMSPHQHKITKQQEQQSDAPEFTKNVSLPASSTQETKEADTRNTNALLKIIIAELQKLIKLFEEQQQSKDNVSNDRNPLDNR